MNQRNRRVFALAALLLALLTGLSACQLKTAEPFQLGLSPNRRVIKGDGNLVTRTTQLRDSEPYTLEVNGVSFQWSQAKHAVDIVIDETLPRGVTMTADGNIADSIAISCNAARRVIAIQPREKLILTPTRLEIRVGAPIEKLVLNGPWDFSYNCPSVARCEIALNGAADGDMTFGKLDQLRLDINGAGDLTLNGAATQATINVNGAGSVSAFGLNAEHATIAINGAGDCEITALQTLSAEINGLGDVTYHGSPRVTKTIHGLGNIHAGGRDEEAGDRETGGRDEETGDRGMGVR
ncbi:MAG: DUF2807 domain-containing protein [Oscillospiraceae bacterium]|jgi:hypothetical protein|nr:DUF2807 domain-containing protein [Oscillospiraceae bacterium]